MLSVQKKVEWLMIKISLTIFGDEKHFCLYFLGQKLSYGLGNSEQDPICISVSIGVFYILLLLKILLLFYVFMC